MYARAKAQAPGTTGSRTRLATGLASRQRRDSTTSTPTAATSTATRRPEYQSLPTPLATSSPSGLVEQSEQLAGPTTGTLSRARR